MRFVVLPRRQSPPAGGPRACILVPHPWNAFGFTTLYDLWFRPAADEAATSLGPVKIAHAEVGALERHIEAGEFETLDDLDGPRQWFSLGQDDAYYENLRLLPDQERLEVLRGLNDLAFNPDLMNPAPQ
ncbi:hypothetical protein ACFCZ6_32520 [Streptomyces hydrogenans]|uniref:hypothetical protein n=1 Tax=Streptomyces hydrogenans TaxID=1873719 RepID=UPI0035DA0A99